MTLIKNNIWILKALTTHCEQDDDNQMTLNIHGTKVAMRVDLNKLRDAVSFVNGPVKETISN